MPETDKNILDEIVETDKKGRYSYNSDETKIRANQGHSVNVNVGLTEAIPPKFLFHGTSENIAEIIIKEGLSKQSRLYVHLSEDKEVAKTVGSRKGKPKVFQVKSGQMHEDGFKFFLSKNNVWLIESVEPKYLKE